MRRWKASAPRETGREGENLRNDLIGKLTAMECYVAGIESSSPSVVESYRSRLYDKLSEVLSDAGKRDRKPYKYLL